MNRWIPILICLWFGLASSFADVTPWEYLASQPKPNFAAGSTYPLMTRQGWDPQFSTNTYIELANNWGMALTIDCLNVSVTNIFNTNCSFSTYVNMASNNPAKYKLNVYLNITWPTPSVQLTNGFFCTNSAGQFVDITGTNFFTVPNYSYSSNTPIMSPEAPASYLLQAANYWVADLITVLSNAPVAYIETDGEYGLGGQGDAKAWAVDPRVQSAMSTNGLVVGGVTNWMMYATLKKSNQLAMVRSAVNAADPNRALNIWYAHSNEQGTTNQASGGFYDALIVPATADLPSQESYCLDYTTWPFLSTSNVITGKNYDLLTKFLSGQGYTIANGYPLEYSWVTGGNYYDPATHAPANIYQGFLKVLATGGAWGFNAGYYGLPTATPTDGQSGWNDTFNPTNPPDWLVQIMSTAHTEALFSHLTPFLTNGVLLTGSTSNSLRPDQPAYEFTNTVAAANDRVLARKMNGTNLWLVTAWAADGISTNVTVNIPTLGALTVSATPSATVYEVTLTSTNIMDEYSSWPSALTQAAVHY